MDARYAEQLKGRRVTVVGAGTSGRSVVRLLVALEAKVRLTDKNIEALTDKEKDVLADQGVDIRLGTHSNDDFADSDLVILSPGVRRSHLQKLLLACPDAQIVGELEFASWFVTEPVIAVTGTVGKTTTTSLIGHILSACGRKVFVGGNIGSPLSDYVLQELQTGEKVDFIVVEASSFQLMETYTLHPKVAILLNFSSNHLDWHEDLKEYFEAKLRIFANQTFRDLAILPPDAKEVLGLRPFTKARCVSYTPKGNFVCDTLPGEHNRKNIAAAYLAVGEFGITQNEVQKALETFYPGPYRLQKVGEKNGVAFVCDSKATTVEAMRAAVKVFERPVRLLAGGVFKGGNLEKLLDDVQNKVVQVGLFGGSKELFEPAFAKVTDVFWENTLEAAMTRLYRLASPGDVILLSPGTSSFDQYRDYKDRGEDFIRIFSKLPEKREGPDG